MGGLAHLVSRWLAHPFCTRKLPFTPPRSLPSFLPLSLQLWGVGKHVTPGAGVDALWEGLVRGLDTDNTRGPPAWAGWRHDLWVTSY